jgi:hypothetical protein
MRAPSSLEISARDFALPAGHRLTTSSLLDGTLNSAAAFSMAAAPLGASTIPSHTAFLAGSCRRLHAASSGSGPGFSAMQQVSAGSYLRSIRLKSPGLCATTSSPRAAR